MIMIKSKFLIVLAALMFFSSISFAKIFPYNGELSIRAGGYEKKTSGEIDFLLPIIGIEKSFLFINPYFGISGGEIFPSDKGSNGVGAGYRHYFAGILGGTIFGINYYYDYLSTETGEKFEQKGAGVEILSKWFDARANVYEIVGKNIIYMGKNYNAPHGNSVWTNILL